MPRKTASFESEIIRYFNEAPVDAIAIVFVKGIVATRGPQPTKNQRKPQTKRTRTTTPTTEAAA